ncbi:transposase, IS4 family [Oesophagostomum dentatum]|uniref:Transposase, IS4 family n=1 Tax=Oesophagostomum dentatum TaxID=61180 RepID=A0A0B1S2K2_OESDE|nr:transposase, IS4 family [Oesophagostomum dentatum]
MGISQPTVSNAIKKFINALNHPLIVRKFLRCDTNDLTFCRRNAAAFSRCGLLPNIIGAVDGTCIRISKPPNSGAQFYCRKGYCALNVVAAVDARGRFVYVNANFPGSVHDSTIYSLSALREAYEREAFCDGYCFIGDSGFSNGNDILTPFRSPETPGQRNYNKTHKKMRVVVECTFGSWKKRFSILESKIRLKPDKAAKVVMACAVLHNMMIDMGIGKRRHLGRRRARIPLPPPNSGDIRDYLVARL